jgi:hypothetical protein
MINVGNKVVCMQEHVYYRSGNKSEPLTHKQGNIYEVCKYDESDNTIYIKAEESYVNINGLWFSLDYLPETPPFPKDVPYFKDYFVTLAEWRDKQINSILDD